MSSKKILLSHPDWKKPKAFPKEQALGMLRRQKLGPRKYQNKYQLVEKEDSKPKIKNESSPQGESDKKANSKAKK